MEKTPSHILREVVNRMEKIADVYERFELEMLEALGYAEKPTDETRSVDVLTDREREIFILLSKGYDNKTIAERLTLNSETVRGHVNKIRRHLKFDSLQDLKEFAIKQKPH